ncbi:MAG: polysaccharide biosynthesis C-terminal domain-containing protein [Bacteroidetes bacterium]|nr:polysaccharide biosynthesis C-terminal domain-containing protein [Bacteroidota bacterium]MBU1721131.1 polysaccharide biosynthesis C-terminal domain-containing protein [Bacteroidota bacterium]
MQAINRNYFVSLRMLKKILNTIFTKLLIAFSSLGMIILVSNELGTIGTGTVSLIVLSITISGIISGFAGGGAAVYLVPRFGGFHVFVASYIWAIASGLLIPLILTVLNLLPSGYSLHIFILSIINGIMLSNQMILIGKERISLANLSALIQSLSTLGVLFVLFTIPEHREILSYIIALYCGYAAGAVSGLLFVLPHIDRKPDASFPALIRQMAKLGFFVQSASVFQILNYRLAYYFIDFWFGRSVLGLFSVAVQVAEGLWIVGKSIALVQYSKISNTDDKQVAAKITISLFWVSTITTALMTLPLLLPGSSFYTWIFGPEFSEIPSIICYLAPGIVFVAGQTIFSHYFAGLGKHYYNMIAAVTGLAVLASVGAWLIFQFSAQGAAIASTVTYATTFCFQGVLFFKVSKLNFAEFVSPLRKPISSVRQL